MDRTVRKDFLNLTTEQKPLGRYFTNPIPYSLTFACRVLVVPILLTVRQNKSPALLTRHFCGMCNVSVFITAA